MFSDLSFEIPRFPVPKSDEPSLESNSNNVLIDFLDAVNDSFGFFSLLSWLEIELINCYKLSIEATTQ